MKQQATMKQRLALADQRANNRAFNTGRRLAEVGTASSFARPGKIHPAIFEKDYGWSFEAYRPQYAPRYVEYLESIAAPAWTDAKNLKPFQPYTVSAS